MEMQHRCSQTQCRALASDAEMLRVVPGAALAAWAVRCPCNGSLKNKG